VSWNGEGDPRERLGHSVQDIVEDRPYHFSRNCNRASAVGQNPAILFLNDDVSLDPSAIDYALETLRSSPDVGAVGASLRFASGRVQHAGIFFRADGVPYHRYKNLLRHDDPLVCATAAVPAVTGAFLLTSRRAFSELKFDEGFDRCGEDIDLCLRIQGTLKKRIVLEGRATGLHEEGATRSAFGLSGTPPWDLARLMDSFARHQGVLGGVVTQTRP
jgi:GT2 family glycosyltransferase